MDLISKLNRINEDKNKMISKLKSNMNLQLSNNLRKWPRQLYKYNNLEFRVNFYDYDGTVLYSYLNYEFLELDEMPPLPTRQGLICQGWNWDLDRAQEYVGKYGSLDIGATYTTDDGSTRLYIELLEDNTSITIYYNQLNSSGITSGGDGTINWGDGTSENSSASYNGKTHIYSSKGMYVISLSAPDGYEIKLGSDKYSNTNILKSKNYYLKRVEIGDNIKSIYRYAFQYCYSLQSVTIPNSLINWDWTSFEECSSLQSIVIPNSITSISSSAFRNCHSLQNIILPDSVTSIGGAFNGCSSLRSITIPDSVTSIGGGTFQYCTSLQNIILPDSVTSIGVDAFRNCHSLRSITIPDSVTSIGVDAFYHCTSLHSITIPNGVTSIGAYTFYHCDSLQSITIPDSVTEIDSYAFWYCTSLQSITILNSVTSIGGMAFQYCSSLQNVVIGNSVTSIGNYAFQYCSSLQNVVIGNSVTTIGNDAFYCCYSIQYIDCTSCTSIPTLGKTNGPFNISQSNYEIRVPTSLYDKWCNATNWATYKNNIKPLG